MKKVGLMAGLAVFICACGGSDKPNGFTYGAPTTPSDDDVGVVSSASEKIYSSIQLAQGGPDASTAVAMIGSIDLGSLFSASGLRNPFPPGKPTLALSGDPDVVFSNADTCLSISTNTITYSSCQVTYSDVSMTINGTVSAGPTSVTWSLTMTVDMTDTPASLNVTANGNYAFGATTLVGSSTMAMTMTVPQQGTFGMSLDENVDVTFDVNACESFVTAGSYELALRWSIPSGVPAEQRDVFKDRGVRVTWQSCGTALISHSL